MTTHTNVRGTRDTMHMHAWADGGGSYAAVVELHPDDAARVTLIGDTVDTYPATILPADERVITYLAAEYANTADYAGAFASDIPGTVSGANMRDDYLIVSHGLLIAVHMFGMDYATAAELVITDYRANDWTDDMTDAEVIAAVRDVLTLPDAEPVVGAYPLEDDGTELFAAYVIVLSAR